MSDRSPNPRQRAVAWLGRREYSVAELEQRLRRSGYEEEAISATIGWLKEHDLVSDARFAEALTRARVGKGFGPRWIENRLRGKGLAEADIEQALAAGGHDWRHIARRAARKRFGAAPCQDLKEKSRRYRFLVQRGFLGEQIQYALENDDEEQ